MFDEIEYLEVAYLYQCVRQYCLIIQSSPLLVSANQRKTWNQNSKNVS